MTKATKIIRLSAENVKRLRAVEIKPDGAVVQIAGANGARFPSPQAMLDQLVGGLSFDPLAFARMKPAEQRGVLREIVGLDTSQIEAKRADIYEQRTVINRETKRLAGELSGVQRHPDAPAEEVSIIDLAAEMEAAENYLRTVDAAERDVERAVGALDIAENLRDSMEAEVERLEMEMADIRKRLEKGTTKVIPAHVAALAGHRDTLEKLRADAPDREAIRAQLANAERVNVQIRDNVRRTDLEELRDAAENTSRKFTAAIAKLDEEKAAAIVGATYPLDGLAVDDEGVLLNGLPLEQASSAEQLRCSIAIGLALNPQLRVLLVRDGSLLDEDSMRLLTEAATAADAQVWLEVVGDGSDGVGIVIEDGAVRSSAEATK